MDKIAFITENALIYWSPIILAISGFAAALVYLAVYIGKGGKFTPGFVSIPVSAVLGILVGRLFHWYCRTGSYTSFESAFTDFSRGDFALVGMFIGCMITAVLIRLIRISDNLPKMLDAMSIGGCIGISAGRLSSLFNDACRGMLISDEVGFPFTYPLVNPVSGVSENRLATFMIQSAVTALIAAGLLLYMFIQAIRKRKIKDGDIFLLFLAAYSISQIVCDSTRYDALVFRSNGFVSMVQIISAVALAFVITLYSVRLVKNAGFKFWHLAFWTAIAGLLGLAGYMEYFVQNNGVKAAFAYSMMSGALIGVFGIILIMRYLANKPKAVITAPQPEVTALAATDVEKTFETCEKPAEIPEKAKEKAKLSKKQKSARNCQHKARKAAKRSKKQKKNGKRPKSSKSKKRTSKKK